MTSEPPPSFAPKSSKDRPDVAGARTSRPRSPRAPRTNAADVQNPPVSAPSSQTISAHVTSSAPSSILESTSKGTVSAGQRARTIGKTILAVILVLLIACVGWVIYLVMYGNSKLEHIEALSKNANTDGETYLIVGSDKREEGVVDDGVETARADTIMILQLPENDGRAALVSIPRDTLVDIPGHGKDKINHAYVWGGPTLLVETVEGLTHLTVDHYVEVSMGGVENLVEAVGGVNLCYDADVSDPESGMEWTAGCHDVNGKEALAFSRMRKADLVYGDIGRTDRQRQVVAKIIEKAASSDTLMRPGRQRALVGGAAENLTTDPDTSIIGLGQSALGLKSAMGEDGLMGAPPISNMGLYYNGQSCVELDPEKIEDFWSKLKDGTLTKEDFFQMS